MVRAQSHHLLAWFPCEFRLNIFFASHYSPLTHLGGIFAPCSSAALINLSTHTSFRKVRSASTVSLLTAFLRVLMRLAKRDPLSWKTIEPPAGIQCVSKHASRLRLNAYQMPSCSTSSELRPKL